MTNDWAVAEGVAYIFCGRREPKVCVVIDAADLEKVAEVPEWFIINQYHPATYRKVPYCYGRLLGGRSIPLSRFLLNTPTSNPRLSPVDHGDRDTLNNRRQNLSILSLSDNCLNKDPRGTGSTGCLGVTYSRARKLFISQVQIGNQSYSFGTWIDLETARREAPAARAAKIAEVKAYWQAQREAVFGSKEIA